MNVDEKNDTFWSELCGTHDAKKLGVNDKSPKSIQKFDEWYLAFYPYLLNYIPTNLKNKKVLEIGLGYGTLSSVLIKSGSVYTGLDVARGPVEMNQYRAKILGAEVQSSKGSALRLPFEPNTFDHVVSIGCLHHTGDLPKAISEVMRVLKPGGIAHLMVYNALSYRQFISSPFSSIKSIFRPSSHPDLRSVNDTRYDANAEGIAAPETVYVKPSELRYMVAEHNLISLKLENIGVPGNNRLQLLIRKFVLKTLARFIGLDIYLICEKKPKHI